MSGWAGDTCFSHAACLLPTMYLLHVVYAHNSQNSIYRVGQKSEPNLFHFYGVNNNNHASKTVVVLVF